MSVDRVAMCCVHVGPDGVVPTRAHSTDAGFDLAAAEAVLVQNRGITAIRTDVRVSIPAGFYGRIVARSSAAAKYGVAVLEGIIDAGYTGELLVRAVPLFGGTSEIPRGAAIAQLIICPLPSVTWVQVETPEALPASTRGAAGFGSTGEGVGLDTPLRVNVGAADAARMAGEVQITRGFGSIQVRMGERTVDEVIAQIERVRAKPVGGPA